MILKKVKHKLVKIYLLKFKNNQDFVNFQIKVINDWIKFRN